MAKAISMAVLEDTDQASQKGSHPTDAALGFDNIYEFEPTRHTGKLARPHPELDVLFKYLLH